MTYFLLTIPKLLPNGTWIENLDINYPKPEHRLKDSKDKKKKKNPIKGWYPPPPALYVRGLTQPSLVFVSYVANDHDDGEHKDDNGNEDFYEGDYPI